MTTHDTDTNEQNTLPAFPPPPTISELTQGLRLAIQYDPDFNEHTFLERQAEILNMLFAAVIDKQICPDTEEFRRNSNITQSWLDLALRTQKQCLETLKARAAIDYMDSITTFKR